MLHAVILAGGSGTRFWPASRKRRPKQMLVLVPGGGESLLGATRRRLAPLVPAERTLVSTSQVLVAEARRALPELPTTSFLAEPVQRNTAPCIAWAAWHIARTDPEGVVAVVPSDQHVQDDERWREVVEKAAAVAASGVVTLVGIPPTRAETGFGWMELGERSGPAHRVLRFEEKPGPTRARELLEGGRHLWNSGMFFFQVAAFRAAVSRHLPAVASAFDALDEAARAGREQEALQELFPGLPSVSLDHGLLEHLEELAAVPGDFGWSDLGSWQAAWELAPKDAAGNAAPPGTVLVDASQNLVHDELSGEGPVVALLGVEGLCVVRTRDALLVLPRDRAQDVRAVVEALATTEREHLL